MREYVDYLLLLCECYGVSIIVEYVEDEVYLECVKCLFICYV